MVSTSTQLIEAASKYSSSKEDSYRSLALVHNHDTGASVVSPVFGVMMDWCDEVFGHRERFK